MKYIKEVRNLLIAMIITIVLINIPVINKTLNMFLPIVPNALYVFLLIIFIILMIEDLIRPQKKIYTLTIIYSILIILTLYVRTPYDNFTYNQEFYLKDLFRSSIVFINVLGNLVLFMPLGYIYSRTLKLPKLFRALLAVATTTSLEWIQFLTRTGVLDIIDIVLNSIGVIIVILIMKERSQGANER